MAITFPRDMPTVGSIEGSPLKPQRQQATSVTGGGNPNVTELGPPMWRGEWSVRTLGRAQYDEWDAWLISLRGGLRTFKGTPRWRRPRAYPRGFGALEVGGSPWDGFGAIAAISSGRDVLTVDGLPVGLVLNTGDWLSFAIGNRQMLHKILAGATAAGDGAVIVTVEPTIRPDAEIDAPVRFDAPYCDMVLAEPHDSDLSVGNVGTFSFTGLQVLG